MGNPWAVEQIEDFLYFCCPECDHKCKCRNSFIEHGLNRHPNCKETLLKFMCCKEEDEQLFSVKHETKENEEITGHRVEIQEIAGHSVENQQFFCTDLEEANYDIIDQDMDYHNSGEGEIYDCDLCEKSFQTQTRLNIHVAKIHQKKKKSNGKLKNETRFESKSNNLTENPQNFSGFKCELCDEQFADITELKKHILKYHKRIKCCPCCPEVFKKSRALKCHISEQHPEHCCKKGFTCEFCGKTFTVKNTLQDHIKSIHDGVLEYKCDKCGREFGCRRNLVVHMKGVHEKLKNYVCHQCGQEFGYSQSLKTHMKRVHEKFKCLCEICKKEFPSVTALRDHKQIVHDGVNKYECKICHKNFGCGSHLRRHYLNLHKVKKKGETLEFISNETKTTNLI